MEETKFGQWEIQLTMEDWLKYMNQIFFDEQQMLEKQKKEREWQFLN